MMVLMQNPWSTFAKGEHYIDRRLLLHRCPVLVGCNHRQDVILGNDLVVLVAYLGVPAHLAISGACTQCLLFAGQANLDRIAVIDGLGEAQVIDTVVSEDGTEFRIDKQSGSK